MTEILWIEAIEDRILTIRGQQVLLDSDLAELYGVPTRHLNLQVKRNRRRFPRDFMFRLTDEEWKDARRGRGTVGQRGGRRYRPYAFTEPGAGMLASVLRNPSAVAVTIDVLRTFACLRRAGEEPEIPPEIRKARSLFGAIRDAVLMLPEDKPYITEEPYTYFLQAGPGGPIKIGSTRNLPVRLRSLSMMSPVPLKLLGIARGDIENLCHARLAVFRVHGEWFAPSPEVLDFIRENAITPDLVGRSGRSSAKASAR